MGSAVGFSAWFNLPPERQKRANVARERALAQFSLFDVMTFVRGESTVEVWGRPDFAQRVHELSDGSLLVLVGSPLGEISWRYIEENMMKAGFSRFEPPWDGRFVLFHVSADGKRWTMWNDWLGSIPVFHSQLRDGRIASTIEPVIVAAAGFTPDDFFMPGLSSLFINGHFFGDWTLYKGMKTIPPDCRAAWNGNEFQFSRLWTVTPSQDRWEAGWNDLVDEMHGLVSSAIADSLKQHDHWLLPLSAGLDSRLIAGVGAKAGVNMQAYAWGEANSTDVIYSRQVARALGLPWKHVELHGNFLPEYTQRWAHWFGSGMFFHGMYMMSFLDRLKSEPDGPVVSGFIGDRLSGGNFEAGLAEIHQGHYGYHLGDEWHVFWTADALRELMKIPLDGALEAVAEEIANQINLVPGARFQQFQFLALWGRQRMFIPYQCTLSDYWRGVGTPFINRAYARFCLSLPKAALDGRRLLGDVFRRYYGPLAVIPGTYAKEPFIPTGQFLIKRRIAEKLPPFLRRGPFAGFDWVPLRMDFDSAQRFGKAAFWPLFDVWDVLATYLNMDFVERDFQTVMNSQQDDRPLKRLQTVQVLAYRLLDSAGA